MNNRIPSMVVLLVILASLALSFGCTITPGIGIGIDFDYYGGKFHARPSVNVGITGHP